MATIGFIGLGNMGLPMAINLVKAGHTVRGFDIAAANLEAAGNAGISTAGSAADAAVGASAVITMLPAGKHVLQVLVDNGVVDAIAAGALLIDCSTIDISSARRVHELAAGRGVLGLDAPVSGGVSGAAAGTLTFMAGGSQDAFSQARPLLEAMGKRVVHCGDAGSGQAAKVCNNMILGISMIGVCEAFVLAEKIGLSPEALFDVASTSSGQCWSLTTYCPVPGPVATSPANNSYKPGFASELMVKDLGLSQDAARETGAMTPLGQRAFELYREMVEAGRGGEDFSSMINMLRDRSTAKS